jgi:hypothetical protein
MGLGDWLYRRRLRRAMLFTFWDGQRRRRADGQRLWRRYRARQELIDPLLLKRLQEDDPEATEQYLAALAEVFEVRRYDPQTETGLTDVELLDVAVQFGRWIEKKKAPPSRSPT